MHGRGSTDMKCGVAAFVSAIANMAEQLKETNGVVLVITAGEEIGCEGAFHLARDGALGSAGAIVVAEPTSCGAGRTQERTLAAFDAQGRHRSWVDASSRGQRRLQGGPIHPPRG